MSILYSFGIRMYHALIRGVSTFNPKAKLWVDGRKGLQSQLANLDINKPLIWFHCASLGEFEQGKPVMESFKKNNPYWLLLVTFYSPSGYEVRKNDKNADYVFYLPEENPQNVSLFLNQVKPKIAVFVKYEFWYGYMEALNKRSIPLVFISSSFRRNQIFFKRFGSWYLEQLKRVTMFFVQNNYSKELLAKNGIDNVVVSGDTRFDRVYESYKSNEDLSSIELFKGDSKILVFGSAWQKETEFAIETIKALPLDWKVIYAPHEIDQKKIERFEKSINCKSVRFGSLSNSNSLSSRVLIVDNVGYLARIYKYSDIAVVGGGFTDGIHNILEPLAFGSPVFFGPKHGRFGEAQDSIVNGVGFEINSISDFINQFEQFQENPNSLKQIQDESRRFILERKGATSIISNYLNELVKSISFQI